MKFFPFLFYSSLVRQIKKDKKSFWVFFVLRAFVILVIIRSAIDQRWESVFVGVLALVLFMIPPFIEKSFRVELPTTLEIVVFVFIFCAEILGEIEGYYVLYPFWDTALHTVNGFIFAAFGFCLIDILNQSKKFRFQLSPHFLALVAFCFSMTIGVLWEFFEFGWDMIFQLDMQKDSIVNTIGTVHLDPSGGNTVVKIKDILYTTIHTSNADIIIENGYSDIGLIDTIKDLVVNFIGAVIFSIIGYFYIKRRGKGRIASQFIPVFLDNPDDSSENKNPDQITFDDLLSEQKLTASRDDKDS